MNPAPDLSGLTLPELRALEAALRAAVAAAKSAGASVDCALLADAEGVSVTFTIPVAQAPGEPTPPQAGTLTSTLIP